MSAIDIKYSWKTSFGQVGYSIHRNQVDFYLMNSHEKVTKIKEVVMDKNTSLFLSKGNPKDLFVRVSQLSDGSYKVYINPTLFGGMVRSGGSSSRRDQRLQEKEEYLDGIVDYYKDQKNLGPMSCEEVQAYLEEYKTLAITLGIEDKVSEYERKITWITSHYLLPDYQAFTATTTVGFETARNFGIYTAMGVKLHQYYYNTQDLTAGKCDVMYFTLGSSLQDHRVPAFESILQGCNQKIEKWKYDSCQGLYTQETCEHVQLFEDIDKRGYHFNPEEAYAVILCYKKEVS